MFKQFSNEQLAKLTLHTTAINGILLEALLAPQPESPAEADIIGVGMNIDIHVIDPDGESPFKDDEPETLNIDVLCGDWKGGRKKPDLTIFKAEPGYMAAFGKKPKNGEVGDCYLIDKVNGNLCVRISEGYVYLSHDCETDTLNLFPGGEYTRVSEKK